MNPAGKRLAPEPLDLCPLAERGCTTSPRSELDEIGTEDDRIAAVEAEGDLSLPTIALNEHLHCSERRAFDLDVELLDRGDEHMAAVRLAPQDGREQSHHRRPPDRLAVVVPGAVARDKHPGIAAAIGVPLIDRRQLSLVDQPLELG